MSPRRSSSLPCEVRLKLGLGDIGHHLPASPRGPRSGRLQRARSTSIGAFLQCTRMGSSGECRVIVLKPQFGADFGLRCTSRSGVHSRRAATLFADQEAEFVLAIAMFFAWFVVLTQTWVPSLEQRLPKHRTAVWRQMNSPARGEATLTCP